MAPILASDLVFKLATAVGPGNSVSQPNIATASLGHYISTTQLNQVSLNNLFTDATATGTEYRCVFVHNKTSSGNTLKNAVVYLVGGDPAGGTTITIGVDSTLASNVNSATAQAGSSDGSTVPATVSSWSAPSSASTGISLGDLPPGYCKAIWIKRVLASVPSPAATETIVLAVSGTTSL